MSYGNGKAILWPNSQLLSDTQYTAAITTLTPRLWVVDFVQLHPVDVNAGVRVWF